MEGVAASIKEFVLVINPDLDDDAFLDYIIKSVINKALTYTNRYQYVAKYEKAVAALTEDETLDPCVGVPIPEPLYTVLAEVVIGLYRTVLNNNTAEANGIKSLTDGQQSVTFGDAMTSYLRTSSDTDIFSGSKESLDNFRIATVVENPSRPAQNILGPVL